MLYAPNGDPLPRIVSTGMAHSLGFSPTQIRTELRSGRWDELTRGIYLTRGELPRRADWVRAGLTLGGPDAVVSGWDAARAYDLGAIRPPTDYVLILTPGGTHRVRGRVRLRPSRRTLVWSVRAVAGVGPLPVAGPARAVADTALEYRSLPAVRALVTAAAQRGLCTADELWDTYATGPRNRSAHLRRAILDVFGGAASISEAELAELMVSAGLPPFELNVVILDSAGNHVATADVLWRALGAILEVDSRAHHFLEPQWKRTMRRHNLLTRAGLAVTHYPPADLRDRPETVVAEVDAWLRRRAVELGVGYPPAAPPSPGRPFILDQQGLRVVS